MNQQNLTLLGRATKEPEVIESKTGKEFTKFSVAINRFRPQAEENDVTFYDVVSFGRQPRAVARKVKKGDVIFVSGTPQLQAYMSKAGEPKAKITINARYIYAHTKPAYLDDGEEISNTAELESFEPAVTSYENLNTDEMTI